MSKITEPTLISLFGNLLWAHSPRHWILKTTYFHQTLFVSMLVENTGDKVCQKIRRSFRLDTINDRSKDLWGLALDCIDEMKTEARD